MIGRLRGILAENNFPQLILEVEGIGFEVEISLTTQRQLPEVGQPLMLHIHQIIREDAQLLYGFSERCERDLFRQLIRLNGVGPKLALAILSALSAEALAHCVQSQDSAALIRIPGVGKKTAERLLVELKNCAFGARETAGMSPAAALDQIRPDQAEADAINALITLGFKATQASQAVSAVKNPNMPSDEIIRCALRNMGSL